MSELLKVRLATLGILLVAVLAVFFDFPQQLGVSGSGFFNRGFTLGLDLQGGTHLVYRADVSEIPENEQRSAVEGVRDVIERRVNAFGVAEPLIQTTRAGDEWRIIAELAGISDINQAINLIGETPLLEFREVNPNPNTELTDEERSQMEAFNATTKTQAETLLTQARELGADFSNLAREYSQDTGSALNGGDLGFVGRGIMVPAFETVCFDELEPGEVYASVLQTDFGYHIVKQEEKTGVGDTLQVRCSHILLRTKSQADFATPQDQWSHTGLSGKQLKRSQVVFDQTQIPQVNLEFNDEGAKLFADITLRNLGKPVAIFLDGEPISTPTVQNQITNGQAVISGQFTIAEARLLSQRLNAGALPVPIELISQQTVGASLGQEAVERSFRAGLIGLIAVSLFMIAYYRLLGVTAILALFFYGAILLAIFKLVPITLTLAGMAGFILSLGMAVDANILIFERFKEELAKDKPMSAAIREGFKRAWPSIFDGNVSTIISSLTLMGFTTSSIKGFAVTLTIGIIVSMFSAVVVTRVLIELIFPKEYPRNGWLWGIKKKT